MAECNKKLTERQHQDYITAANAHFLIIEFILDTHVTGQRITILL